jgi:tRNA threonylcarbamoyladenosine biosynthesis protein TsaB
MILTIDTTIEPDVLVSLSGGGKDISKRVAAPRQQAEKLLPLIIKLLDSQKISLKKIKEIRVQNQGGNFTSLRIGVLTANALAYALGIEVKPLQGDGVFDFKGGRAVKPEYESEPNIGRKKGPAC